MSPIENGRQPDRFYQLSEKIHENEKNIGLLSQKMDHMSEIMKRNTKMIEQIHDKMIQAQGAGWGIGKIVTIIVGAPTVIYGIIKATLVTKGS